jgi:ferric-dicitrate binding protein FerR (iron transport regulator)
MHFNSIEEVIANDHFRAWYFKNDESKAKEWENWLLLNQQYILLVEESIALMNELNIREKELAPEQTLAAFQKLQVALEAAPLIEIRPQRKRWWIPAAAVLLLIVGFAYWNNSIKKTTLGSSYGTIRQYQLPDGSQVMLNANSKIILSKEWEKGTDREVWLKGEAFFKVQKTPLKSKFIVHADNMDIIVTGTQFNVVNREEESSILLIEGSVTISTYDGNKMYLQPGDFVKIENSLPTKEPIDQQRVLAWKQAKLDFENTPISEVAKIIARHYGIKVNLADSTVGEKKISGVMPNDNLDVLIEALEATGEFKVTKAKDVIIISDQ